MKQKGFMLVCLFFIYVVNFYSQIVNEGTLQINPSTTIYFGQEYTNKSTATHSNNGELYLNSNFVNNGITSIPSSGTTFFNSSSNAIQVINGSTNNLNFYNLEVNNSLTGVSVANDFGLTVANKIHLEKGDLRLVGSAQLVQTHTGVTINTANTGKLLRDQQGISSTYGYNYWGSPVNTSGTFILNGGLFDGTDESLNSFNPKQVLFNSGSPYNGTPSITDGSGNVTTALTVNNRWMYTYAPNASGYAGWVKIDQNSSINPGVGYTMKGTGALSLRQNYVFKGTPNDGDYSFTLALGEYMLMANPYPSALDCTQFITDNLGVINTLYFWVDGGSSSHVLSDYLGGYATRTLATGVLPSIKEEVIASLGIIAPTRYMGVGQGFFAQANNAGTVVFKNSHRALKRENGTDSYFFKKSDSKMNPNVKSSALDCEVKIKYYDPETFTRQLSLSFLIDAPVDLNFNSGYDAVMIDEREDELFYIIENDLTKKYIIQAVGAFNELYEFPLGFKMTELGVHKIEIDQVVNFSNTVYIKDKVLDTYHNLSLAPFYPNLAPGVYLDRFSVVFINPQALDVDEISQLNLKAFYNGSKAIIVQNPTNIPITSIGIFNVLGQNMYKTNTNVLKEKEISIPFNHQNGVYFVRVETEKGIQNFKIITN